MKMIKNFLFLFLFFFLLWESIFSAPKNYINQVESMTYFSPAKQTEYHDFSEANDINQDYSFSTLYLTEKTEFSILKSAGTLSWTKTASGKELPSISNIGVNQELILLISNCAVNKEGDVLDVVIKINKVNPYRNGGVVAFTVSRKVWIVPDQNRPTVGGVNEIPLDVGNPLAFDLNTNFASCDFTMTYYKTGTYDVATDKGDLGNISLVNGFFFDIDIIHGATNYSNQIFGGKEGLRPNVGSSIIYYNKKGRQVSDPNYRNTYLQERDNGIAINTINYDTAGMWYATSALMLTGDLSDSRYSFTYGGVQCGISYFFSSPYPYDITEPIKSSTVEEITPGESFTYEISQYIPNNYYANLFNFHTIYGNFQGDAKLNKLVIQDSFSSLLDLQDIFITNETGTDVTDLFVITKQNNEIEINTKEDTFLESTFYNHTYTIYVPVTLKSETSNVSSIKNISSIISKIGDNEEKTLETNEVELEVKYKIMVNYYKEGTKEKVAESDIFYFPLNESYDIKPKEISSLWKLVDSTNNTNGIIKENLEVNYYFRDSTLPDPEPPVEEPIPPIEEPNPDTGAHVTFVIVLVVFAFIICFIIKRSKKIYKL